MQNIEDCNAIIKDGTAIMVGGYTLIDRPEVGNSVYIDISLREICLDGGGVHERF